jgi:hypothetical protein
MAFLLSLAPQLFGPGTRLARILLGLALVLIVLSLNALILYSTQISSIRLELSTSADRAAEMRVAAGGQQVSSEREAHRGRVAHYAGDSVIIVSVFSALTGALAVAAAMLIAFSS